MSKPLRVLIVEDSEDDALLLVRHLEKGGYDVSYERVDTPETLAEALKKEWDIVLSDFSMPRLNGFDSLSLVKGHDPYMPFIMVSGKIGEETAVELMKAGAQDYIMKEKLARLVPAVEREISEAEVRRGKLLADEALKNSEARYRALVDNSLVGIYKSTLDGDFLFVNDSMARMFEFDSPEEMLAQGVAPRYKCPRQRKAILETLRETGRIEKEEVRAVTKNGKEIILLMSAIIEGETISGMLMDVTDRKRAEEQILLAKLEWERTFDSLVEPIMILERDHRIRRINRTMAEKIGMSPREAIGMKCYGEVHRTTEPIPLCPHEAMLEDGQPKKVDIYDEALGGYYSISVSPIHDSDGNLVGSVHIARDINDRKLSEDRIKAHMEQLQALRTIDMAINSSLDIRVTLDVLIEQVISRLQVDAAAVLLLNPHSYMLDFAAGRGFWTEAIRKARVRLGEGYAGKVALERKAMIFTNLPGEEDSPPPSGIVRQEGFRAYFGVPLIAKGQVQGVLEIYQRSPMEPEDAWLQFLEALAGQAAIAIDNASLFDKLQQSHDELILAYDTTIEGWSKALDYRDKETEGHSQRVTEMTLRIAQEMGMREDELVHVRRGALLHDIGKLGVPDAILFKPGELNDDEWKIMKRHTTFAYELLAPITYLKPSMDIPYCHHERWDGTGYPRGLAGEQIPLAARIFAVVDVWDALSSDRPYRSAWEGKKVLEYIESLAGVHFDSRVVEIFMRLL